MISNDKEVRNKRIIIRVTDFEKNTIDFCCKNSFSNVSDVGRRLFFEFCCEHNLRNNNRL